MMCYRKVLQIYVVISESIILKYFRWFLMIQLLSRHMSFDGWACAICVLCFKRNGHSDAMEVLIDYYHSKCYLSHQSIGCHMWCKPKSYTRGYMHFCVPCIVTVFAHDPCAGTSNDCICCLH